MTELKKKKKLSPKQKEVLKKNNFKNISKEKFNEIQTSGSKKGNEEKRRKKSMKECLNYLLDLKCTDSKLKKKMADLGITDEDMTNNMSILVATINQAQKGQYKATSLIAELVGEKVIKQEIDTNLKVESFFENNKLDL